MVNCSSLKINGDELVNLMQTQARTKIYRNVQYYELFFDSPCLFGIDKKKCIKNAILLLLWFFLCRKPLHMRWWLSFWVWTSTISRKQGTCLCIRNVIQYRLKQNQKTMRSMYAKLFVSTISIDANVAQKAFLDECKCYGKNNHWCILCFNNSSQFFY